MLSIPCINKYLNIYLTLSRLLYTLLIINKYDLSIQNFKCLIIMNLKPLVLNVGLFVGSKYFLSCPEISLRK